MPVSRNKKQRINGVGGFTLIKELVKFGEGVRGLEAGDKTIDPGRYTAK